MYFKAFEVKFVQNLSVHLFELQKKIFCEVLQVAGNWGCLYFSSSWGEILEVGRRAASLPEIRIHSSGRRLRLEVNCWDLPGSTFSAHPGDHMQFPLSSLDCLGLRTLNVCVFIKARSYLEWSSASSSACIWGAHRGGSTNLVIWRPCALTDFIS